MNLGRKTLWILVAVSAMSLLVSYFVLKATIYQSFVDLEKDLAETSAATVIGAIDTQLETMTTINLEYSEWNDTYEFLSQGDDEFLIEGLPEDAANYLNSDAVMLFNADGGLVVNRMRQPDGSAGSRDYVHYPELSSLFSEPEISKPGSRYLTGVVGTKTAPLLVVARPVVRSDGSGPAVGTLVLVQELNDQRILVLRDKLNIEFSALPLSAVARQPELQLVVGRLRSTSSGLITITTPSLNRLFTELPGLSESPGFLLEIAVPRSISLIGASAVRIALIFLAMTSLLYLLVSNFSLKRLIIGPVETLTALVGRIEQDAETGSLLDVARGDEVGILSRQIGSLVTQREAAHNELIRARDGALQASKAKSEFLATMSHEIRTPINGVLGMTELLLHSTRLDKQQRQYAETAKQSGEALLHIINDILDLSKIEAGKIELDVAPFNLRHLVEECLEMLAESAHRKGLELIGDIPANLHVYVQGDPVRLRQVVINLVSNAVKFTEYGEVVVRLRQKDGDNQDQYSIEVIDTGIGIREENLQSIFEPFLQEDGSTTRRYGGTGLGLSICKQLVGLMGGKIGASSEPGHGSNFHFTVRLQQDVATGRFTTPTFLNDRSVLIVDDNSTNRSILSQQLASWNITVVEADSGESALEILTTQEAGHPPFDAILLDMQMPEMHGLQLAQEIRDRSLCDGTPLIMLSSLSGSDTGRENYDVGLQAWLTKPVRRERLREALVSVLSNLAETMGMEPMKAGSGAGTEAALHVLLAEDFVVNQLVARGMLESLGHTTEVVANGIEALEKFKEQEFDLVLMDCRMPEMDGYAATRSIRQWERENHRQPTRIVALTANALDGDRDECIAAGMNDYVTKPFTMEQLDEVTEASRKVA